MNPLVSVVMPVYNAERYIKEAVESILNQTYTEIELIAVIDAPTDQTADIISSINDVRLKLFYNSENRGIAYSTNRGIEEAKGKYIALMDHDDVAVPDRIEVQVEFMENHEEIDILGGADCTIDQNGNMITYPDTPRNNPKYIKAMLLFQTAVHNATSMIRKSFIDANHLRYRENCYGIQDFRFFMESSKVGQITSLNKLLNCWRSHENNTTKKAMNLNREKRDQAYALCQRDSLQMSGFVLEESEMEFLNRVLSESGQNPCQTIDEFRKLYDIFKKIIFQAQEMDIDFYEELYIYCRKLLAQQLCKVKIF